MQQEQSNNDEKRRKKPLNQLRAVIDLTMLITCFLMAVTAVLKWPSLYDFFFKFYETVSFRLLSTVHDLSGIVFIIAMIVHLILSWKRFIWLFKRKKNAAKGSR